MFGSLCSPMASVVCIMNNFFCPGYLAPFAEGNTLLNTFYLVWVETIQVTSSSDHLAWIMFCILVLVGLNWNCYRLRQARDSPLGIYTTVLWFIHYVQMLWHHKFASLSLEWFTLYELQLSIWILYHLKMKSSKKNKPWILSKLLKRNRWWSIFIFLEQLDAVILLLVSLCLEEERFLLISLSC